MSYFHQVARLRPRTLDLLEPALAPRVWSSLRRTFPLALVVLLMPTHVHLILAALAADDLRHQAARALARAVRGLGRHTWEPLPPPELLRDRSQLRRSLRYVPLNPCRWGLVDDPLAWQWSSYRDLFGASVDPWIEPARLAMVLGEDDAGFLGSWHQYVSSDRSVAEDGTPPPRSPLSIEGNGPIYGIQDFLAATAAATRTPVGEVLASPSSRRLLVALADRAGWSDPTALSQVTSLPERTVRRYRSAAPPAGLDAALACLAEPRLRIAPPLGRPSRGNPFTNARRNRVRPLWD